MFGQIIRDENKNMRGYKLTYKDGTTIYGSQRIQWSEGFTHHDPKPESYKLCGAGWLHFYQHSELVDYWNATHAQYPLDDSVLWEIEAKGKILIEHDKCGARTLTAIKKVDIPLWSMTARRRMAILCTLESGAGKLFPKWNEWAVKYLLIGGKTLLIGNRFEIKRETENFVWGYDEFSPIRNKYWSAQSSYASVTDGTLNQDIQAANAGIYAGRAKKDIDFLALSKIAKSPAKCREYLKSNGLT